MTLTRPDINLIFEGNSLTTTNSTLGAMVPYNCWVDTVVSILEKDFNVFSFNPAIGGSTTAAVASRSPLVDRPEYINKAFNILHVWEGTNDLVSISAGDAINQMRAYCLARRAYGFKVLVGTVVHRSQLILPADFESKRQTYNQTMRNTWATFADGLVDYGGETILGSPGASSREDYFYDKCHLTAKAQNVVALQFAIAVRGLLNSYVD